MSATNPSSEHFSWPSFYEDPDAYWQGQAESEQRNISIWRERRERQNHAWRERQAEKAVHAALAILRERGLLREDRLSYTRICELEHETGIFAGSWIDYLNALHEAELRDRELCLPP
jgi:predicted deacylase